QVYVEPIIDIRRFRQQAQSEQKPLLNFGKSVNQLSKLVRDHGYQPLVRRPEPYKAAFIVPKDSSIQSFSQLGGRKLLLPDEFSATTAVAKAEIRRMNMREPYMAHSPFQDTVAAEIKAAFRNTAVINPTLAKERIDAC